MVQITLITVVKNNLEGIKKTIKSLRSQDYESFEHVIIDSNSTDGTSDYIKDNLNSKTIYKRENDKGIYDGINKGIKVSRGKYIGLLHSGDIFFSKSTLKYIAENLDDVDYIFGNVAYFKNKKIKRIWDFGSSTKLTPFKIAHTSLFIKKKIIENFGFYNTNYQISSDLDFLIKLSKKNYKYKKLEKYLIYMATGGISFSLKSSFKKVREDLTILFKYYNFLFIIFYIYKILIKLNGINKNKNKYKIRNLEKNFLKII